MPGTEAHGCAATQVDDENFLRNPVGQVRRIRGRLVRILDVAAPHEQQLVLPRNEREVRDLGAVVRRVVGEDAGRELTVARLLCAKPNIAMAPDVADPGRACPVWGCHEVRSKRRAQDLIQRERGSLRLR